MRIHSCAQALLVRLDKEIARQEQGTAAIGGLTKIGNNTEELCRALLNEVAAKVRVDPDAELRRRNKARGTGTYLVLIKELSSRQRLDDVVARALVVDACSHHSYLWALANLRNKNNHPGWQPGPDLKRSLQAASVWLKNILSRRSSQ